MVVWGSTVGGFGAGQSGGERRAGLTSIDVPISLVGGGGRGGEDGGDGGEGGRVHCSRGGRAACGGGAHQTRETADRSARRARTGKRKPRGRPSRGASWSLKRAGRAVRVVGGIRYGIPAPSPAAPFPAPYTLYPIPFTLNSIP